MSQWAWIEEMVLEHIKNQEDRQLFILALAGLFAHSPDLRRSLSRRDRVPQDPEAMAHAYIARLERRHKRGH